MSFKQFYEARIADVEMIRSAIEKVSDRPFNELFKGHNDRFMIRVYNPYYYKALASLDIYPDSIDLKTRTINGKPLQPKLKLIKTNAYKNLYSTISEVLDARGTEIFDVGYNEYSIRNSRDFEVNAHMHGISKNILVDIMNHPSIADKHYVNSAKLSDEDKDKIIERLIANRKDIHFGIYFKPALDRLDNASKLKQLIDQNNIYYYLVFSRSPIDVLRMSDHSGISSCHRLDGGSYRHCAIADAKNNGGIVYLIKGTDGRKAHDHLNDDELFIDKDRKTGLITPIGRIRLRRFIDLKTGDDFAVPTTLRDEQKYGFITSDIYKQIFNYVYDHQSSITNNPPSVAYARENIVLVGGEYSDEDVSYLLTHFFHEYNYNNDTSKGDYEGYHGIKHKEGGIVTWDQEIARILKNFNVESWKPELNVTVTNNDDWYLTVEINMRLEFDNIHNLSQLKVDDEISVDIIEIVSMLKSLHIDSQDVKLQNGKIVYTATFSKDLNDPAHLITLLGDVQEFNRRLKLKIDQMINKYQNK
jgi:hypothetical protein